LDPLRKTTRKNNHETINQDHHQVHQIIAAITIVVHHTITTLATAITEVQVPIVAVAIAAHVAVIDNNVR
jgi:hypothetical protein